MPTNTANLEWSDLTDHEREQIIKSYVQRDAIAEGPGGAGVAERIWQQKSREYRRDALFALDGHDGSNDAEQERLAANVDTEATRFFERIGLGDDLEDRLGNLVLTRASDIKIKPTKWLWQGHIPLGEITVLAGREDLGKSTIAMTWGAQVTQGTLRGEYYGEPRDVLICAVEDSWDETVVPRLIAAGADLKRVHQITMMDGSGPDLAEDLDKIRAAVEKTNAALIIFDPLTSRLGERVEQNKGPDVRRVLEPVKRLAMDCRIAVMCIMHVNKSTGSDANSSIMGSSEFKNIPRCVMFATKDREDESKRYVGVSKLNIGLKPPALEYSTTGVQVQDDIWTSKIVWQGESAHSIDDLWSESQSAEGGILTAQDDAMEWLGDYLAEGEKESNLVKTAGKDAGHKERTLQRARSKLGVKVNKDGKHTYWSLPEPVPTPATSSSGGTGGTGGTRHDSRQNPSTHTHANTYLPCNGEPVPPVPSLGGTGTNNEPTITRAPLDAPS
jgi:AAA domain